MTFLEPLAIPAMIAGTAVGAAGTIIGASQQAAMARFNAAMRAREADYAKKRSAYQAADVRRRGRELLAKRRAAVGASGAGPAIEDLATTVQEIELEALMEEEAGQAGYIREMAGASLARLQASSALTAGAFGAGSTLLTGAAETSYMKWKMK
jgi:hypothetical protein